MKTGFAGTRLLVAGLLVAALVFVRFPISAAADTQVSEAAQFFLEAGEAAEVARAEANAAAGTTEAAVRKLWIGDDPSGFNRRGPITVRLYRDGRAMPNGTWELNEQNDWTFRRTGLPEADAGGQPYAYAWRIVEDGVPEGYYTMSEPVTQGTLTTVTNTLTVGSLTIVKEWLDRGAMYRPARLSLRVTRRNSRGEVYGDSTGVRAVTMTWKSADADNASRWTLTLDDLPLIEGDTWTVRETVPAGYRLLRQPEAATTVGKRIEPNSVLLQNQFVPLIPQTGLDEAEAETLSFVPGEALRPEATDTPPGEEETTDWTLREAARPAADAPLPTRDWEGETYCGLISVPSLELELPVTLDWSYERLKLAPSRYVGSPYSGDLILLGHNNDAQFGGIRALVEGDEVRFEDMEGRVFRYAVLRQDILGAMDIDALPAGDAQLTLLTCTDDGQMRLAVRCREITE